MPEAPFYFPPFHPGCRCTVVAVKSSDGSNADMSSYSAEVFDRHYGVGDDLSIVSVPKNWNDVKSLDQAKLLMKNTMPDKSFDLADIDADIAALPLLALDNASKLISKYPEACPNGLKSLKFMAVDEGSEALGTTNSLAWSLEDGSGIVLNKKYWSSAKVLEDTIEDGIDAGTFHVCGTVNPAQYVVSHEIGHAVYSNLSQEIKERIQAVFKSYKAYEQPFSRVSCQNANEFFAEVFAHLSLGDGASSKAEEAIKQILEGRGGQ